MRILLLAALALSLTACAKAPGSDDSPNGFIAAWRQFLELDAAPVVGPSLITNEPAKSHGMTAAAAARAGGVVGELDAMSDQLQSVFGDGTSMTKGFPTLEDNYRNIPVRFRAQMDKIRENKGHADGGVIQRRITDLTAQAMTVMERQHTRVASLQETYQQKLDDVQKRAPSFEQQCAKMQAAGSQKPEEIQACTKFQDANTMLKTKSDLVIAGFAHIEDVYKEVRAEQMKLNADTLAGK